MATDDQEYAHIPRYIDSSSPYDYDNNIYDYESMDHVTHAINKARRALFEITNDLNTVEAQHSRAKITHDRAYRRSYLDHHAIKPDSARRMTAEMECEEHEDQVIVYEQRKNELSRLANSMRIELQALQAISNNIRQQTKG